MDILKQENGSTCASRTAVLNHRRRSGKATAVRHAWTSLWLDVADKKTLMSLRLTTRNENVYFEHCPYVLIYFNLSILGESECHEQLDADLRFWFRNEQLHVPVAAKRSQREHPLRDESGRFK